MTNLTPEQRAELRAMASKGGKVPHLTFGFESYGYLSVDPSAVLALLDQLDQAEQERDEARNHVRALAKRVGVSEDTPLLEIAVEVSAALERHTIVLAERDEARAELLALNADLTDFGMKAADATVRAAAAEAKLERVCGEIRDWIEVLSLTLSSDVLTTRTVADSLRYIIRDETGDPDEGEFTDTAINDDEPAETVVRADDVPVGAVGGRLPGGTVPDEGSVVWVFDHYKSGSAETALQALVNHIHDHWQTVDPGPYKNALGDLVGWMTDNNTYEHVKPETGEGR